MKTVFAVLCLFCSSDCMPQEQMQRKDIVCNDVIPNCASYGISACYRYPQWMHSNCAEYCNVCGPTTHTKTNNMTTATPVCSDKITNCNAYSKDACKGIYVAWAQIHCRQYCGLCGSNYVSTSASPCYDNINNCQQYGKGACQGLYEAWARSHCRRYCGFCH